MRMRKDWVKPIIAGAALSGIASYALYWHLASAEKFDDIALALFVLFLLPLILSFAEVIELPGGTKIRLNAVERRLSRFSPELIQT